MKTLNERIVQYLEQAETPQAANMIASVIKTPVVEVSDALDKMELLGFVASAVIDGRIRWSLPKKEKTIPATPSVTVEHTPSILAEQPNIAITVEVSPPPTVAAVKQQSQSKKANQTTGALVMSLLTEKAGTSIQMGDIADAIGRGNKTVSVALHYLKKKGLVTNPTYGRWQLAPKVDTGVVIPEPVVTKKNQIEWTSKTALTPPQTVAADGGTPLWAAEKILEAISPVLEPKFGYFSDGSFLIQSTNQTMILNPEHVGSLFNFVRKCQLEVSL